MTSPPGIAHSRAPPGGSGDDATNRRLSGENPARYAGPSSSSASSAAPVVASQIRAVRSVPVVNTHRPSGEKPVQNTRPAWPVSVARGAQVRASHNRAVPSQLAVTTVSPSGLTSAR
jgi:hypothetical protein